MKLILTTEAKTDIKEAANWYNGRQRDLGKQFTKVIRQEIKTITANPEIYSHRYKNVRTALIAVFPYMIHYDFDLSKNQIIILGVVHTSLNPNWK